jgi:hypothetical protein
LAVGAVCKYWSKTVARQITLLPGKFSNKYVKK